VIASPRTRHVRVELFVKRVVIIVKVSFVGPAVVLTVPILHQITFISPNIPIASVIRFSEIVAYSGFSSSPI